MSEATEALLAAYRDDLQRQMQRSAVVDRLQLREDPAASTLIATVRIGVREYELSGTGANVVTAYAELLRSAPEPILAAAYTELLDSVTHAGS